MSKHSHILSGAALLAFASIQPLSLLADPSNLGPPAGWIWDLANLRNPNPTPLPTDYTQYSVSFTAASANTDLRFALRNDSGYWGLDDISMVDNSDPAHINLVVNGGFDPLGNLSPWNFDNPNDAVATGFVSFNRGCGFSPPGFLAPHSGTFFWCDGTLQAYDTIDQNIVTTIGDSYTISFWLVSLLSGTAQQLSTTSDTSLGNGADVLVYAQSASTPPVVPEPVSLLLFGSGLAGIGLISRCYAKKT